MILRFLRNKVVEVEPQADGSMAVVWRSTEDLLTAEVDITIQLPDLEIVEAEAALSGLVPKNWQAAPELIKRIEGVRVGAGFRKIVHGLLEDPQGCPLLAQAVLESANAVILNFTRPVVQAGEQLNDEQMLIFLKDMVKNSPRLVRSCVAFQDDSPIMRGL